MMQKEVHDTIDGIAAATDQDIFFVEKLQALAERLAVWATRDMHDDDDAKLRSRTYALAGAVSDWADAFGPPIESEESEVEA